MSERAVWKWVLRPRAVHQVPMPEGAKIVYVGQDTRSNAPAVWALVDPSAPPQFRTLYPAATGECAPEDSVYVGTAICGQFAWHVFERATLEGDRE